LHIDRVARGRWRGDPDRFRRWLGGHAERARLARVLGALRRGPANVAHPGLRPGVRVDAEAAGVPDRARADGARAVLSAGEPRLRRTYGRASTAHRDEPRRPDRRGHPRIRPAEAVLHEP